jgi:hypothetical protein
MKLWVGKTENPRIPARIKVFRNHTGGIEVYGSHRRQLAA